MKIIATISFSTATILRYNAKLASASCSSCSVGRIVRRVNGKGGNGSGTKRLPCKSGDVNALETYLMELLGEMQKGTMAESFADDCVVVGRYIC